MIQMTYHTINYLFFIPEEVINEIKTELDYVGSKNLNITKCEEFAVSYNLTDKPMIFKVHITGLTVFKSLECLHWNLYFFCSRVVAVAEDTRNLGIIIKHAYKNAQPVKLTSLANFGKPSGTGTKNGFKKIINKNIFQTRQMF